MGDRDLWWVAGLLEGEGSFQIAKNCSPFISCGMTDLDVLERLQSILGGNIYAATRKNPAHKQSWSWVLKGKPSIEVMRTLRPLMGSRRQGQIDRAIDVWSSKQNDLEDAASARLSNAQAAADFYRTMPVKSLRAAAAQFGISHVTLSNYLRGIRSGVKV